MSKVTFISTLPPIEKGMSKYSTGLIKALSEHVKIEFLGFDNIYPSFLYKGKIYSDKEWDFTHKNLKIRNVLDWYNPIGWIIEAFILKSKVIHAQHWTFFLSPIYWAILGINKIRGKKIILTIHNIKLHEGGFLKNFLYESVFFLGNEFIVHTQNNKKELQKIVGHKKIHVVPHGLIEPPQTSLSKKDARKKLNINNSDKIALCFGNIRDYKGVAIALKALSKIKDSKVKLIIAGECWENWSKYQHLINKFNLNDRVYTFIEFIPDEEVEVYVKASDVILLPYTHFEAQSGVASMALPFEKPLIVSNVGGLPELVLNDNAIFKTKDSKELGEKIEKLFKSKQLYNKLTSDVKKLKKQLSWQEIVKTYARDVY